MQIARKTCEPVLGLSRSAHIVALALVQLAASPALAQPAARVVVLAESAPDDPTTAELARALRPHLASADVTLRLASLQPPSGDDLARAAWGAEVAAREEADAVLWLEAGDDDALTLRLVDARARVQVFSAPPGDRFDQVRTVALAARSHVARAVERVRREDAEQADAAPVPESTEPEPGPARALTAAPLGALSVAGFASPTGLAAGLRLEGGLALGRLLELRLGAALLLPEDVSADNAGSEGSRVRLPAGLTVATVLPVDPVEVELGIEGLIAVAFLEDRAGSSRTRIAPLLGLRAAVRHRPTAHVFVEIPVSFRVRIAAPGSDPTWSEDAVAPALEVVLGASVGVGG